MSDMNTKCRQDAERIYETVMNTLDVISDSIDPGEEQMKVLACVVSHILCSNFPSETDALVAFNVFTGCVADAVTKARNSHYTMWVGHDDTAH